MWQELLDLWTSIKALAEDCVDAFRKFSAKASLHPAELVTLLFGVLMLLLAFTMSIFTVAIQLDMLNDTLTTIFQK